MQELTKLGRLEAALLFLQCSCLLLTLPARTMNVKYRMCCVWCRWRENYTFNSLNSTCVINVYFVFCFSLRLHGC